MLQVGRDEVGVTPSPGAPVITLDPYSDEVMSNPYPYYQEIREAGPLVWMQKYGTYAVGRYASVMRVLTDHETFCSSAGVGLTNFHTETPWRKPSIILEVDRPEHTRTRKVFSRILSPRSLGRLRERFEQEAQAMVTRLVAQSVCDGVRDIAEAYPLKVFADAVGLPAEGREHLLPYGDMVFNAFGPQNDRFRDCLARLGPSIRWINEVCQRKNLSEGSFGAELYAAADAGEITHEEAGMLVRTMLSAGLDTTIFTIGNALACFARYPDQWAAVRHDPAIARQAIEEVLRYDSTFHSFYRTTTQPVTLEGVDLDKNQKILVLIASANRDASHWTAADTFDVHRKPASNLAFGTGIHGCAGQMIARLEAEIVLKALAAQVEVFEALGEPELHFNNTVRGYSSLRLRLIAKEKRA
ncbi:cytochrome P450 [Bradyrhizobium liaoningense]|uniref:cytochrome P450 n=1 Tax=Bradyrhizobium liaoningense TaxID=43992 RepID=UPI001BA9CA0F|nr:cytochrome P450 [Bradyrhizobium liaoningense]MBR0706947.1 cytochrome P450 [Bradyrhizobium liaoningense]